MKKLFVGLFAAAAALTGVADVTAPTLKAAGFCNGHLNVTVQYTGISTYRLQVQMKDKDADDSTYRDVYNGNVSSLPSFTANSYDGRYLNYTTNFVGTATLRMRTVSGEETSAWVAVGDHSAYVNAKGTAIGNSTTFNNSVDGNFFSMVDESGDPWIGYEYSEPIRIRGIRFFSRPDDHCYNRIWGAKVQYASDANFGDGDTVTVFTSSSGNTSRTTVADIFFDDPVTAKCVRILSASGGRSSVCEFEVIPADIPYRPVVSSVVRSDITNFWPIVSWTCPANLMATEVRVMRSSAAEGPYEPISDWLDAAEWNCLTNDTAYAHDDTTTVVPYVGIQYYYRVEAKTGHPNFPDQVARSVPATYRRYRRLDRAWGAETTLLPGVSVISKNAEGTSILTGNLAWDGNPGTFPDNSATLRYGPVGLAFASKTFVVLFGYQCRNTPGQNAYCSDRVKATALYSASAEDESFSERVKRSAQVSQASCNDTFYLQEATSVSEEGEDLYFLYSVSTDFFGGNVAELMFFGWDAADIVAAGVLVAPKTLAFERSVDGRSVTVSWDAGANAVDGYEVQRRTRGSSDAWTTVATPSAGTLACTDSMDAGIALSQGVWEYRVVAKNGDETAESQVVTYTYYEPGDGTGLRGAVFHPFVADRAGYSRPDDKYDLGVGVVDFHWTMGECYPGTDFSTDARLAWRGKIIAPLAGSYDFELETSDGGAVYVDGASVCNIWTGGSKTSTGSLNLTAGEHEITVDARLQSDYAGRKCVLRWGGTVPYGVVPATQLKPADEVTFALDDWTIRTYNGAKLGRVAKVTNGYRIVAPQEAPSSRNALNATMLARKWKRSFDISVNTASVGHGRAGLMARGPSGNLYAVYYNYSGSGTGFVGVYMVTNGSDSVSRPFGEQQIEGFSNSSVDTRLAYDVRTHTFTAWWKDDGDAIKQGGGKCDVQNPREWTVLHTWTDDGSFGNDEYEFGPFMTGATANPQSSAMFTQLNLTMKRHDGTLMTIK